MVPLDKALVSSYRLSIVTMPLTKAVWPQFAMQVFVGAVSTPFAGMGVIGDPSCYNRSGNPICFFRQFFFGKAYRLATINTLQYSCSSS